MAITKKSDVAGSATTAGSTGNQLEYPTVDAFARAREDEARKQAERKRQQAERDLPQRFGLDQTDGIKTAASGKTYLQRTFAEVVILDDAPDRTYFSRDEYKIYNPVTKKTVFEPCLSQFGADPIAQAMRLGRIPASKPYVATYLTVRELTTIRYTKTLDDGTTREVVIENPIRLLVLNSYETPAFDRLHARFGTLRGVQIMLRRSGEKSSRNGVLDGTYEVERHSEQDLLDAFGHPPVVGKSGDVIKKENQDCYAVDYRKAMPLPSIDEQAAAYGVTVEYTRRVPGAPTPGSKEFIRQTLDEDLPEPGEAPAETPSQKLASGIKARMASPEVAAAVAGDPDAHEIPY